MCWFLRLVPNKQTKCSSLLCRVVRYFRPCVYKASHAILDTEQKFENTKIKCRRNVIVNKCKIKVPTVFTRA